MPVERKALHLSKAEAYALRDVALEVIGNPLAFAVVLQDGNQRASAERALARLNELLDTEARGKRNGQPRWR